MSPWLQIGAGHDSQDQKKPRRSQRIISQQSQGTPINDSYLPTPMTRQASTATDIRKETTATPPKPSARARSHTPPDSVQFPEYSSPPGDTQAFSQFVYPPRAFADEVQDEAEEGVWGYIIPLDDKVQNALVLRKRGSCEGRSSKSNNSKKDARRESGHLANKEKAPTPGGYLVGRHPECGMS